MVHARPDYNRIQGPALRDPSLVAPGSSPIGEDEPVFLLRAKDALAPAAVRGYASLLRSAADVEETTVDASDPLCEAHVAHLREMALMSEAHATKMVDWQLEKGSKLPDIPTGTTEPRKSQTVTIYGASDDLIEVEGDLSEEFSPEDMDIRPSYRAFSDGTVLSVRYGVDGAFWRVNRVREGTATYSKHDATDDESDYSDRVTLVGDMRWVLFGSVFVD